MDDVSLPSLTAGDPRNRLSSDARKRLVLAHFEAERIQWEAEALIQAKHLPINGAKAEFKRNQAKLLAARTVLKVASEEYSKVAITQVDFRRCMEDEIDGAANSPELYDAQRRLLVCEFFLPVGRGDSAVPLADPPITAESALADRKALRDAYFSSFPDEKLKILDVCWAAHQHYHEWKRWLSNELKEGSTADKAFRALLNSGKKPSDYCKQPRPPGWQ